MSMNEAPELSIVTINYNGLQDTLQLIQSIKENVKSVSFEIIVVDNASKQNEAQVIELQYPEVITIRSEVNLGFSGGNNLGIRRARGRSIFLLNNDTYIETDGLKKMKDRLDSSPKIGAVSPKIKFADSGHPIQFAGYTPLTKITLRNNLIGFGVADEGQFEKPMATPYVHGAAMMLKREVIKNVGLMPELYFLYYEELDWSSQMAAAGYELYYEPGCTVYHKESRSTGQNSALRSYYLTRNRMLYAWRNRTIPEALLSICYQITVVGVRDMLMDLLHGRFDLCKATLSGILAFVRIENKKRKYEWIP